MEDFEKLCEFERTLKVGDKCLAYWTNSGIYWRAEVKVLAINKKSYQVEIVGSLLPVRSCYSPDATYPVGHKLNIPNTLNYDRFTWNNRLAPLNETKGGDKS